MHLVEELRRDPVEHWETREMRRELNAEWLRESRLLSMRIDLHQLAPLRHHAELRSSSSEFRVCVQNP